MFTLPFQRPAELAPVGNGLCAGVLAWYGVRMWSSATPVAGGWYHDLGLWWSDPAADQRFAGLIVVAAAVATAVGWTVALRRSGRVRPAR